VAYGLLAVVSDRSRFRSIAEEWDYIEIYTEGQLVAVLHHTLTDDARQAALRENADTYREEMNWQTLSEKLCGVYADIPETPMAQT
jgi:hypothetical protein